MMSRHYAYPKLSAIDLHWFRMLGPGLGNLLFPWARSEIAAENESLRRLRPTWPQLKLGPWARREPDKRGYTGLFKPDPLSIGGAERLWILATHRRMGEEDWRLHCSHSARSRVIVFSGLGRWFEPLVGYEDLLFERLCSLNRYSCREEQRGDVGAIAVHVRLGDFRVAQEEPSVRRNQRTPFSWYRRAIQQVQADAGNMPVKVYSDGSDAELRSLLSLEGVRRARQGNALQDILAMSSSAALIASASTFSGWASFLGRMPTYWPGEASPFPGIGRRNIDMYLTM